MIQVEMREGVATISLARSATNPLSAELIAELRDTFRAAGSDSAIKSILLTSKEDKFLSIGFDIPALYPLDREGMQRFFRLFNEVSLEIFALPKPTVAAIMGHAVAGGCILALLCDRRFIAGGRTLMGLNEVKLGVPVPCIADRIVRDLVGTRGAREILEEGEFYPADRLLEFGLVDRVLAADDLREGAWAEAARLGALPAAAFAAIKGERTRTIAAYVATRQAEMESTFLDGWFSPDARMQLKAAMETF